MKLEDMKKLSNDELKEKVLNINNNQLKNIKRSSLLNILISLNASEKLVENNDVLNEDKHINEIQKIKEIIKEMKLLIIKEDLEKTYELREILYEKKNILDGYLVEISYMSELVDECGVRILSEDSKYTNFKGPDVKGLIDMIDNSLDNSRDNYSKYLFIISEIINILPMNVVKQNYYDIVRDTIKRNFITYNKPAVDMLIDNYKKQFDSCTRAGYGIKFDYYFMEIQKIKRSDLSKMNLDELSEFVNIIIDVTEELVLLRDLILSLGVVINLIIVISKAKNIDIEKEKLVNRWVKSLENSGSLKKLDKELRKEVSEIESLIQKDLKLYEELTIELGNRTDFNHESLEDELMETRSLLTFYNDIGFSDIKFLETIDMATVEPRYLDLAIDSLIDYMERSIDGMSNMERKIRMRKILSLLDLPFKNIQSFIEYIQYCLDERTLDKNIINFKINQISYFLNKMESK